MAVGDLRGEIHRRLHPFGYIPILPHGGYHLYERKAILRYIEAVMPRPPQQLADPKAIERMDQIMGFTTGTCSPWWRASSCSSMASDHCC